MESCLQLPVTRGALLFSEFMGINVNPGLVKSEAVKLVTILVADGHMFMRSSHLPVTILSLVHALVRCQIVNCPPVITCGKWKSPINVKIIHKWWSFQQAMFDWWKV